MIDPSLADNLFKSCYTINNHLILKQRINMIDGKTDLFLYVTAEWRGKTVDAFLRRQAGLSRNRIRALKKNDGIYLDGRPVWTNHPLCGGEELTLRLTGPMTQPRIAPEEIPLVILYEDQDLMVIDKPSGMVVHPVKKHQSGTLANALIHYWQTSGQAQATFHPVHRLDRLTSGTILIAKNSWAHQQLDRQIGNGQIKRFYLAVCHNVPHSQSGRITAPIKAYPETPRREIRDDGKPSLTRYRVLRHSNQAALLGIKLYSGRTHQIRVHLAHIGHSLWGDRLYDAPETGFDRPALHAAKIAFIHPRNGLRLKFRADLPRDLRELLEGLFS
jgi:23S rRNA pseudouridine1911/1915/1917 synthase